MRACQLLSLVPVLLCGCVNGFDRAALQERLNDGALQSPDTAIAEARALKPQLRFPCRIAMYLKPGASDCRWTPDDKAAMEQWAATLKKEGIASDVFFLPEMVANKGEGKNDVKELRLAAAKCGADALFVVHGAAETLRYLNPLSVFNLTVVGGFVVPGSSRESLFVIEGVLMDVDNGYIYTGVQADGTAKIVRPTFVIEDKDVVAKAKAKALASFGDEVLKRMRRLAVGPPFISDVNNKGALVGAATDATGFESPAQMARPGTPAIRRPVLGARACLDGLGERLPDSALKDAARDTGSNPVLPPPQAPGDRKQLFNFSPGLFGN